MFHCRLEFYLFLVPYGYFRINCETICHLPTCLMFSKNRKSLFKYRSWFSDPSVVVVVQSRILYMLRFFFLHLLFVLFGVFIVFIFFTKNRLPKIKIGVTPCFPLILAPYIIQSSHSIFWVIFLIFLSPFSSFWHWPSCRCLWGMAQLLKLPREWLPRNKSIEPENDALQNTL